MRSQNPGAAGGQGRTR
uniref:Uncharacterized protein n=1 Tax=Arundo donax TaxID=35708 RepID=A0A0A8YA44_ARUDO